MSIIFKLAAAQWRQLRLEYQDVLEHAYERAETATNGVLLNKLGKTRGINPVSLFYGPEVRALCYASEELIEHWQRHPRITFASYEKQSIELWEPEEAASA